MMKIKSMMMISRVLGMSMRMARSRKLGRVKRNRVSTHKKAFSKLPWRICATSINAELKDAKKNLPRALVFGSIFVVLVYMLYYVGLAGAVENEVIMAGGETGAKIAFATVFTELGGTLLFVFVVISCLGTLNGLMLACTRGFYAMASRKEGPAPEIFNGVDKATNMPTNSAVMGLFMAAVWLTYFYGANLTDPWFGPFCFDSSELPIITIYSMYIPIFIMQMVKEKELPTFKRVVMPILGVAASLFMVVAAIVSLGTAIIFYLILFAAVMIVGACLKNYRKKWKQTQNLLKVLMQN